MKKTREDLKKTVKLIKFLRKQNKAYREKAQSMSQLEATIQKAAEKAAFNATTEVQKNLVLDQSLVLKNKLASISSKVANTPQNKIHQTDQSV
jgi:hypothetical protein